MTIDQLLPIITQVGFPIAITWYLFKVYLPAQERRQDTLLDKFIVFSKECSDNVKTVVSDNNKALDALSDSITELRHEIKRS
jgi:hypothetical protein